MRRVPSIYVLRLIAPCRRADLLHDRGLGWTYVTNVIGLRMRGSVEQTVGR